MSSKTAARLYSNIHKCFKCLDPSEGRVYISQDVVFDEHVFPFTQMHPNAGARLRAELAILPDVLLNPSTSFGDANLHDKHDSISTSTNGLHSAGKDVSVTGSKILGAVPQNSPSKSVKAGRHFMCLPTGNKSDVDPHAHSAALPAPSMGSSAANTPVSEIASAGSSTGSAMPLLSSLHGVTPQLDPDDGGTGSATATLSLPVSSAGGAVEDSTGGILIPGSSAAETSASIPAATALDRPTTRLQRGISKPKQYTDGTV